MNSTAATMGRRQAAWWTTIAVMTTLGCGTAEYESRMAESIERLKIDNRFVVVDPPERETVVATLKNEQGVGAKISLRKPLFFAGPALTAESMNPQNPSEPLPVERLNPPMLNLPGHRLTFEVFVRSPEKGVGLTYAYFGAQPTADGTAERIVEELKQALPEQTPAWQEVSLLLPDGTSAPASTLELRNIEQPFRYPISKEDVRRPGTLKIWMRKIQGYQVLLALRTTMQDKDLQDLMQSMAVAAGTVRVVTGVKIE